MMGLASKQLKNASQGTTACAHGNGQNTQAAAKGVSSNSRKGSPAWNGDYRMPRAQGRIELVLCGLDDLPAGQYGTQSPAAPAHLSHVAPGLGASELEAARILAQEAALETAREAHRARLQGLAS